jgi:hypothetical protein
MRIMRAYRSISDQTFCEYINRRIRGLMTLAVYVSRNGSIKQCFTRPLLADLLSEATKIEELLDAYGAKNNNHWYPLRRAVAPIKLFSNVSYLFIHILRFLPSYRLLPIDNDFPAATKKALEYTCEILIQSAEALTRQARKLDIEIPEFTPGLEQFSDEMLDGHLSPDRPRHKVASPEETVVYLATAFLNLAEESRFLHNVQNGQVDDYADWIPDPISEERLRNLEETFHNLQSLYDTHISDSNVETLDEDLPVLRGHITVIYHLLQTATAFTHYCERHILNFTARPKKEQHELVDPGELLNVLIHYSVAYASRYITRTRSLCHDMLRRYAIQGRITVPAPRYRGFHVRPSTLVAKIVSHYGSEVRMKLGGETYNAGVTLDLFRANEKINAGKKRWLKAEVHRLGLSRRPGDAAESDDMLDETERKKIMRRLVHSAIQALFSQSKLVLYERNLPLEEFEPLPEETDEEFITRVLIQLLTMGKIDVVMDINVTFSGDQRVLQDIKLLADNGYGEDDFGNNLPLPEKLSYLRR